MASATVGGGGAGGDLASMVLAAASKSADAAAPPLIRAMELGRYVRERGLPLPSAEIAEALVSSLLSSSSSSSSHVDAPALWKLLDAALASRLVFPLHALALLTPGVVPRRRAWPVGYKLYLLLLDRYVLVPPAVEPGVCRERITKSVDDALQLSKTFGVEKMDYGYTVVLFVFSAVLSLVDATVEDYGLQSESCGIQTTLSATDGYQDMDVDYGGNSNYTARGHREQLRKANAVLAIEVLEKMTASRKVKMLLRLVQLNMTEKFNGLLQRLQLFEIRKSQSENVASVKHILFKCSENIQKAMTGDCLLNKHHLLGVLVDIGLSSSSSRHRSGSSKAACWIPFDIFMENSMDGKHFYAISAIEILTELIRTLQVTNQASWQETFQALWISALRLVQRDREPLEGPIPRLDARLCMLLSIVPLAIIPIMKEDAAVSKVMNNERLNSARISHGHGMEEDCFSSRKRGLVSSLQLLGQFSGLLVPPPSVATAANNAAAKAATFISKYRNGSVNFDGAHSDVAVKAAGNMLHLIIEACIARKLIDTSAYFWPGYVVASATSRESMLVQESPWSAFMEGAQLTSSLKNALMMTPASSLVQVEKLYQIALNGSDEEKSAAAKILCGASLVRGWNIQENVVQIVVKLLSPPVPPEVLGAETGGHLIGHMTTLNAMLFGVSCVDIVHILSLYGMIPEVAAALMPLCEVFGSMSPACYDRSSTTDETSIYSVFSCAFLFLLRLWKFYRPPHEHCIAGREGSVRLELTLDYLLLMRNSQIAFQNSTSVDRTNNFADPLCSSSGQSVYIDSFPKLRAWYFQNQACIASTLSGMCNKNPVHQAANRILNMICRKMTKGGVSVNPSSTSGSSTSGSPVNSTDDAYQKPTLPAWEVLEATPFVLEAILTACAHGRLSSRDLTTGLRDLVDFLPASLATIISYFSAEITRGIWKPVPMNGKDWPSPAANLLSVESEIKEILASAGVHVPSCHTSATTPVMLPLPMAALVSLTITFKLDNSLEHTHGIVGQALENCASGCSWPCMPVIGALWTQKVRRWHDFIVFSCARSPFSYDKEAVAQLIRSCFSSFLGPSPASSSQIMAARGVNALLGQAIADQGIRLPIAPGFLYLRSCRSFHDTHFVVNVILKLVIDWAHELGAGWSCGSPARLKSSRISLAAAAARVREIATLGASLLCIAGGLQLVQVLYEDILPTSLLSAREGKPQDTAPTAHILEGYAVAYTVILSGAFVWGIADSSPVYGTAFSSRRARVIGMHMNFIARVVDGNITLGCDPAMWKAYMSCFIGLLVNFVPAWVPEVKLETLRSLAGGLRGWHECDLAHALLERGGPAAISSVVDSML